MDVSGHRIPSEGAADTFDSAAHTRRIRLRLVARRLKGHDPWAILPGRVGGDGQRLCGLELVRQPFGQWHQKHRDTRMHLNIQGCDGGVGMTFNLSTKDRVYGGRGEGDPHVADPDTQPFGVMQLGKWGRGGHVGKILNYLQ